jgi:glutathione S-transferase
MSQSIGPRTSPLRLFTFSPSFGLPTGGPFGLKLEACFRLLGVDYQRVFENDVRKGPKRKSPWIEDGELRLGDTELILAHVARTQGRRLDDDLTPVEQARSHVLRRMIEEHYHAVFEYELFVLDAGFERMKQLMKHDIPALLRPVIMPMARRGFRHHLFERGIARHSAAEVEAMGRADVDALAAWLGDRDWFIRDRPTKADASAFGLLAVAIRSGLDTPVMRYTRAQPNLVAFVDRVMARLFPEVAARPALAA